jgi:hypothetical protein
VSVPHSVWVSMNAARITKFEKRTNIVDDTAALLIEKVEKTSG